MAVEVALGTPLADALQHAIQPKLVENGWSTGDLDDNALAEYILLMLVNGKTQAELASELSNDLLGLGPEDSGANDFSQWLFEQVDNLGGHTNQASSSSQGVSAQILVQAPAADQMSSQDADMGDAMDIQSTMYVTVPPVSVGANIVVQSYWS